MEIVTLRVGDTEYDVQVPDGTSDAQAMAMLRTQLARESAVPKRPTRTTGQQFRHEVEAGARDTLSGVGGAVDFFYEPLARGFEAVTGAPRQARLSDATNAIADAMDLDHAETPTERVAGDVNRALAGVITGGGAAKTLLGGTSGSVGRGVREFFTGNPGLQATGAVTGATAGGVTRENGGSPGAQLAATLIGGALPAATRFGGAAGAKVAVRGRDGSPTHERMQENLRDFAAVGDRPSLGQATERRFFQSMESLLGRTPGARGVIEKRAEDQARNIGARVQQAAEDLHPGGADPLVAGEAIKRGVGRWDARRGEVMDKLYDRVEQELPNGLRIPVGNTLATLRELAPDPHGAAPNLSARSVNGEMRGWRADFEADARPNSLMGEQAGTVPYQAVKEARTQVGRKRDATFGSDTPARDWRDLYSAMTSDMHAGASAVSPKARAAQQRANTHFARGEERKELLAPILEAGGGVPEAVFDAAVKNADKGVTRLTALYQTLGKKERSAVSSAVLERLGRAKDGVQNAPGDTFSPQTFLTNWNKLGRRTRATLFNELDGRTKLQVRALTNVSENIKTGSRVWANPSGSAGGVNQAAAAGGAAGAAASGNWKALGTLASGAGIGNAAARAMTSRRLVRSLANDIKAPGGNILPALLAYSMQRRDE